MKQTMRNKIGGETNEREREGTKGKIEKKTKSISKYCNDKWTKIKKEIITCNGRRRTKTRKRAEGRQ